MSLINKCLQHSLFGQRDLEVLDFIENQNRFDIRERYQTDGRSRSYGILSDTEESSQIKHPDEARFPANFEGKKCFESILLHLLTKKADLNVDQTSLGSQNIPQLSTSTLEFDAHGYFESGEWELALFFFYEAWRKNPKALRIIFFQVVCIYKLQNPKRGVYLMKKLLKLERSNRQAYFLLIKKYFTKPDRGEIKEFLCQDRRLQEGSFVKGEEEIEDQHINDLNNIYVEPIIAAAVSEIFGILASELNHLKEKLQSSNRGDSSRNSNRDHELFGYSYLLINSWNNAMDIFSEIKKEDDNNVRALFYYCLCAWMSNEKELSLSNMKILRRDTPNWKKYIERFESYLDPESFQLLVISLMKLFTKASKFILDEVQVSKADEFEIIFFEDFIVIYEALSRNISSSSIDLGHFEMETAFRSRQFSHKKQTLRILWYFTRNPSVIFLTKNEKPLQVKSPQNQNIAQTNKSKKTERFSRENSDHKKRNQSQNEKIRYLRTFFKNPKDFNALLSYGICKLKFEGLGKARDVFECLLIFNLLKKEFPFDLIRDYLNNKDTIALKEWLLSSAIFNNLSHPMNPVSQNVNKSPKTKNSRRLNPENKKSENFSEVQNQVLFEKANIDYGNRVKYQNRNINPKNLVKTKTQDSDLASSLKELHSESSSTKDSDVASSSATLPKRDDSESFSPKKSDFLARSSSLLGGLQVGSNNTRKSNFGSRLASMQDVKNTENFADEKVSVQIESTDTKDSDIAKLKEAAESVKEPESAIRLFLNLIESSLDRKEMIQVFQNLTDCYLEIQDYVKASLCSRMKARLDGPGGELTKEEKKDIKELLDEEEKEDSDDSNDEEENLCQKICISSPKQKK